MMASGNLSLGLRLTFINRLSDKLEAWAGKRKRDLRSTNQFLCMGFNCIRGSRTQYLDLCYVNKKSLSQVSQFHRNLKLKNSSYSSTL